ncbi:MAG: DUF2807 domain-containing protein [Salinivirgaceae bacterium]|nr:DUF2807 domain-containing protein [Salinivirgaceae bacterium]
MKKIKFFICFSFLFVGLIHSNANNIELHDFESVSVFGKIEVRLEKADKNSIEFIQGDYNQDLVSFVVEENELKVRLLKEFPRDIKARVTIYHKGISSLKVGGGAKVYNKGAIDVNVFTIESKSGSSVDLLINADSISAKVNRGAFVRLTGKSNILKFKTASAGVLRTNDLICNSVFAKMRGGTAEVDVLEYLEVKVWFGATLKYKKKPNKLIKGSFAGGKVGLLEDY